MRKLGLRETAGAQRNSALFLRFRRRRLGVEELSTLIAGSSSVYTFASLQFSEQTRWEASPVTWKCALLSVWPDAENAQSV